jgi:hypothetical protein
MSKTTSKLVTRVGTPTGKSRKAGKAGDGKSTVKVTHPLRNYCLNLTKHFHIQRTVKVLITSAPEGGNTSKGGDISKGGESSEKIRKVSII